MPPPSRSDEVQDLSEDDQPEPGNDHQPEPEVIAVTPEEMDEEEEAENEFERLGICKPPPALTPPPPLVGWPEHLPHPPPPVKAAGPSVAPPPARPCDNPPSPPQVPIPRLVPTPPPDPRLAPAVSSPTSSTAPGLSDSSFPWRATPPVPAKEMPMPKGARSRPY